jgi:hypothetical protein
MKHLSEEELIATYYGEGPDHGSEHLAGCAACRGELAQIRNLLEEIRSAPAPSRSENYGREVWARLEPRLNAPAKHWWARPWIFAPAAAALLVLAFLGGMMTTRIRHGSAIAPAAATAQVAFSAKDRQRVLEGAVHDHLERSEILLAQLVHATPGHTDLSSERSRARDLLEENRLLRETATRSGDRAHAALLDDLERVFLDLANSPVQLSRQDVAELQQRIDNQSLLFRVRVTTADNRSKGNTL